MVAGRCSSAGGGTVGHLFFICSIAAEMAASADWLSVGCVEWYISREFSSSCFFIHSIASLVVASTDIWGGGAAFPPKVVGCSIVGLLVLWSSSPSSRGSTTASSESFRENRVGISRRTEELQELLLSVQQASDFVAVDSSEVEDGGEMVSGVVWHRGGVGLAIKDAMVIMTLDGMPMGVAHSLSTGERIFIDTGRLGTLLRKL